MELQATGPAGRAATPGPSSETLSVPRTATISSSRTPLVPVSNVHDASDIPPLPPTARDRAMAPFRRSTTPDSDVPPPPVEPVRTRMVDVKNPGRPQIRTVGMHAAHHGRAHLDLFYRLHAWSFPAFMLFVGVTFFLANLLFAGLYMAEPNSVANARPGSFLDHLSFSVQTFATVGYGVMYPQTTYAVIIMCFEVLAGYLLVATLTGMLFARLSKPTAQIVFSEQCAVHMIGDTPYLLFRCANERRNQVLEASMKISLIRDEVGPGGTFQRRFYDLPLERVSTPVFVLSWTVRHRIDERSPLYLATPDSLAAANCEIVAVLSGLDSTVGQTIHARYSYLGADVVFDVRHADIFRRDGQGKAVLDFRLFHYLVPFPEAGSVLDKWEEIEERAREKVPERGDGGFGAVPVLPPLLSTDEILEKEKEGAISRRISLTTEEELDADEEDAEALEAVHPV
ncbi:immunoglobulin E-set [Hyaloraphidium curvatum]|nr:immunoglobulin E-set [Hyaloraphidium curvatum]